VFDTRTTDFYTQAHLEPSILLNNEKLQQINQEDSQLILQDVSNVLSEAEQEKFANRRRYFCIIISNHKAFSDGNKTKLQNSSKFEDRDDEYFQSSEDSILDFIQELDDKNDVNSFQMGMKISKLLTADKVRETYILIDGAEKLFQRYPFLSIRETKKAKKDSIDMNNFTNLSSKPYPNDILDGKLFLGRFILAEEEKIIVNLNIGTILNVTSECKNVYENKGT
jgi:hypothetical protein